MAFSKRRDIVNYTIACLKEIDGGVSPYNASYTFGTNVFNNVFRGANNFENINDYPNVRVICGPERYNYNTVGNTEGSLNLLFRCYLHNGERSVLRAQCDNLIQDIDHVIYNMPTNVHNIQTVHVTSIETDQGLLEDYCIIEIRLAFLYELETI